jgi:hypothetical protein
LGEEFDAPFARLDWIRRDHFDIQWHRHTGEWFRLIAASLSSKPSKYSGPTASFTPYRLNRQSAIFRGRVSCGPRRMGTFPRTDARSAE